MKTIDDLILDVIREDMKRTEPLAITDEHIVNRIIEVEVEPRSLTQQMNDEEIARLFRRQAG